MKGHPSGRVDVTHVHSYFIPAVHNGSHSWLQVSMMKSHEIHYRDQLSPMGRQIAWLWWHHQMKSFSALLALCAGNSPVTGEFPPQRPVTRSFDVFFDLLLNKRLSKQSWGWWFETSSCYDVTVMCRLVLTEHHQCKASLKRKCHTFFHCQNVSWVRKHLVQVVTKISSIGRHFCFNVWLISAFGWTINSRMVGEIRSI